MAAPPQQITVLQVQDANLCLTREDIDDDSRKGDTHLSHAYPAIRTFFDTCKDRLTAGHMCAGETLLHNFDIFIIFFKIIFSKSLSTFYPQFF